MKEILPFVLQGSILFVDEWYCHRHRLLREWERLGHPIDSFVYSICLVWLLFVSPNSTNLIIYIGLAILSCLLITKDEWQHRELCTGFENWLHSLLFMIHPMALIWAGWLWWNGSESFALAVGVTAAFSVGFGIYQMIYWAWRKD